MSGMDFQSIAGFALFWIQSRFLFLASVTSAVFGILYFFMPETLDKRFQNPTNKASIL
jgi:hypothetical protein